MFEEKILNIEVIQEQKLLTNPNKRFNPRLNLGGDSGSHRHRFGVHVKKAQHTLV